MIIRYLDPWGEASFARWPYKTDPTWGLGFRSLEVRI